ncbi:unnamed protein product, partial [Iphiclides podalirius]
MIFLILLLVTLLILYLYGTKNYGYWKKRGIKHDPPIPFFGTNWDTYAMKNSMTQKAEEQYRKYPNERVVGFYRAMRPELVIRDPEIAKRILTTDFGSFYLRGFNTHKTVVEPLLRNLFTAEGDLWKLLRQRMTPAFTSGKLKAMFPLIVERAERLQNQAINASETGRVLDAREIMARYTTDFIGACGFGIDADSLSNEDSAFRKLGAETFTFRFYEVFAMMLKEMFPEVFKRLKLFGKVEQEAFDLISGIFKQRNYEPCGRNDFIDLFLELKKKGNMVGDSIEKITFDGKAQQVSMELDEWLMVAQVFVFFAAGFETSSSATSFTLHQLAYHPEEQKKVQEEVDTVLAKYEGKLCYDAVREMTYLDCAFKEAMRIFPSLGFLMRKAARKYTFPELDLTIDEGERLGQMQSIAGLAAILSRFSVEPAPQSLRNPVVDPCSSVVQSIEGGLPLMFRKRPMLNK